MTCLRLPATKIWKAMQNVTILVLSHPWGDLGVMYTVHLWLVGKRMVYFLLVLIEHFLLALTVERQWADIGRNRCVRKGGWVTLSSNLRENGCRSPTTVGGLSHGVVCVILHLAILTQYQRVTDRHMTTANVRAS